MDRQPLPLHMKTEHPLPIIFSDLDGTLLDLHTYDPGPAASVLQALQQQGIPIVFCSSKTRAEQRFYQRQLSVHDPFIVENGAAIYIPIGYFSLTPKGHRLRHFEVIPLGRTATEIRRALHKIRQETGLCFQGYADLTPEAVAQLTGLSIEAARRAMRREYSETIVVHFDPKDWQRFNAALAAHGLVCFAGGRLHTIVGAGTDKGQAVRLLTQLYQSQYGSVVTIGIGDSPNDAPMLRVVDRPFLVQQPDGSWATLDVPGLVRIPAIGPEGWVQVVRMLLPEPIV